MENSNSNGPEQANYLSTKENLQIFFTYHLNRIYAAKLRVMEILDELLDDIFFTDLAIAVRVTGILLQGQVRRLQEVYAILSISPLSSKPNELLSMIESGYVLARRQQKDTPAFDRAILAFLQNTESLELASFKVLKLAAQELNNPHVSTLLEQCITDAESDYELLLALIVKHFKNS